MAKDDHWFKFFYKLFLISTQGWKDEEVGAYVRLLINQFDRGGLPDDPVELSKLITSYKKNWPMLTKKFPKDNDGLLRNSFMGEIREERNAILESYSNRGKKGGRPAKQNQSNRKATAFKDKSDILYSLSPSSLDEEESPKGEETTELGIDGFFINELPKDTTLDLVQVANVRAYLTLTCKKTLTDNEIAEKWDAFKLQNFSIREWYNSFEDVLRHFRSSTQNQILKDANKNGTTKQGGSNRPVITGESETAGKLQ